MACFPAKRTETDPTLFFSFLFFPFLSSCGTFTKKTIAQPVEAAFCRLATSRRYRSIVHTDKGGSRAQ